MEASLRDLQEKITAEHKKLLKIQKAHTEKYSKTFTDDIIPYNLQQKLLRFVVEHPLNYIRLTHEIVELEELSDALKRHKQELCDQMSEKLNLNVLLVSSII